MPRLSFDLQPTPTEGWGSEMEVVVMKERRNWFLEWDLTEAEVMADLDPGQLAWELEPREVA